MRILIADRNRYHAMLIEREILAQTCGVVCTFFQSGEKVLTEISKNNYSVVVIDSSMPFSSSSSLLNEIRAVRPDQLVILTVPDGQVYAGLDSDENGRSALIIKDGTFHLRISRLIEKAIKNGSFDTTESRPKLRMSNRRKADVINIAASTLAHEINNPLMTILGMTELLLESTDLPEDGRVSSKVKVIQESARRIQDAMKDLASISRPTIRQTAGGSLIETGLPDRDK